VSGTQNFATAVDGTRLFYELSGDGPVVVLCDGIACDGFVWKYLQPVLTARYRVLHWHYRGHGRSGPPIDPTRITVDDHARDLHAVLDHAGVERAVLVGHSMGTQVCLEAYRQHPARVFGLCLLCGSYGRITRTFHGTDLLSLILTDVIDFFETHPGLTRALWSRGPASLYVALARRLGELDALRIRVEDILPYFEHVSSMDPAMFFRMLRAAGEHSAEAFLPDVRVPTLVVAAERDTFTPVRHAEQMARQIPDAEFLLVKGASHAAPIEQPELINRRVVDFLERRALPEAFATP
jgi:pimeloyl-ACP methyl ester carboxylesterase